MSQSAKPDTQERYAISGIVGVVADAQTYKNLLYLLLAFPLGLIYYTVLLVGFALGVGLSVLLVGLAILFGTAIGVRAIASFERKLANTLLGTEIATPTDVERGTDGLIQTAKEYFRAGSTWRGLGFVGLKFWIGTLSFVLLVSFLGTGLELLMMPVFPDGIFNVQIAGWEVAQSFDTPTKQMIAVPAGAVLSLAALHILNAFASANAAIASSLLGTGNSDAVSQIEPDQSN